MNNLDVIWMFRQAGIWAGLQKDDEKRWKLSLELMQAQLVKIELLAQYEVCCRSGERKLVVYLHQICVGDWGIAWSRDRW